MDLAVACYAVAMRLPNEERYGLASQVRRAAVSVPSNIAEGHLSGSDGILGRHLRISLGSVGELQTHMELIPRLGLLQRAEVQPALEQLTRTTQVLHGFVRSVRAKRIKKAGMVGVIWLVWFTSVLA